MIEYENLLDIPFEWGKHDCFSMVIDFYKQNFGIKIRNYARPTGWSSDVYDMMRIFPEREGFDSITSWKPKDLRIADVMCIPIGESNPNHFAIYIGDNKIIHHLYGRFSSEAPLAHWPHATSFICRHPAVPDLKTVLPDVSITDLLSVRNAPPAG